MFQTVRHWWSGGRGKVTARLFLFELFVVILGVLIAQGLADWMQSRAERDEGRELLHNMEELSRSVDRVTNYWQRHGACLRDHVENVARSAVAGRTLGVDQIGRPGLPQPANVRLDENGWRKLENIVGVDRSAAFRNVASNADYIRGYETDLSDEWATFKLLDREIGPPSAGDVARVRQATAIIDNRIRWLMFNRHQVDQHLANAGVAHRPDLPNSERLVDRCGLLKDWR